MLCLGLCENYGILKVLTLFQNSDSSDTMTSSDSSLDDNEHRNLQFIDEHEAKKESFVSYQNLLDDDDSGIVLTASHSSIDRTLELSGSSTSMKSVNIPPPRPPPRKSRSPQTERKIEDRLVIGRKSASNSPKVSRNVEDRLILEQKSSDVAWTSRKRRSLELATKEMEDLLINLDPVMDSRGDNKPMFTDSMDSITAEFDSKGLQSAGDYVKLRETPVKQNINNRRSSINRTPAIKLPPDVTPKRPSVRRERSPISPDEEEKGISAFDPLWGQDSPTMQLTATKEKGSLSSVITTSPPNSNSDSLLKSWDISQLTTNIQSSGFDFNKSTSAIPPAPGQGFNTSPYFSPQPFVQRNMMSTQIHSVNTPVKHNSPPQIPPRPKNRPLSQTGLMFQSPQGSLLQPQSTSSENLADKSDPFADLVSLNKERTSPQPKQSRWEQFE